MLSNTCKYAIRSVIYLALNSPDNQKIGIKKIADDLKIPSPFLGKIMQVLAKNKILASTKGPNGGFSLGKPANKITLMDIVEIIDGSDSFESCVIGLESCSVNEANCPIHEGYAPIREQAKVLFATHTIESFANAARKNANVVI
jgi:Rrf2 family transcriptional regulator, iron-sulfur cluster assembly transcription factor